MSATTLRTEMLCILYGDIVNSTPDGVQARKTGNDLALNELTQRSVGLWRESLASAGVSFFKPLGDGLLATFADPVAALRAALGARAAMDADPAFRGLAMRVGLHVGMVSVQADGDILGADAAVGHRIMKGALPGEIVLSEGCASQIRAYLPDGCALDDVGENRLEGFETPFRLFRLRAPGLPDLPPRGSSIRRAPVATDRFVGRRRERAELRRHLADSSRRCVTIVGSAGCGKTRLALQVADDSRNDFPDGVQFVPLEEATDADGVLHRIASALSVSLSPMADPMVALRAALAGRRLAVILDNFEQAISAASVVSSLLEALPEMHALITSREPLRLRGELVYDLEPLCVPEADADFARISRCDSVRLFVERVKAVDRRFALTAANAPEVAAICRAVSGLPLALEIVAAEARHRSVARLRDEIRAELLDLDAGLSNVPSRQRTLRGTFDWTCRQLRDDEQMLLAQLGLFESSFGEEEMGRICTVDDPVGSIRALRDKSLIVIDRSDERRPYRLLVPVRQYARARLGRPAGALRARYIRMFLARAVELIADYRAGREPQAIAGVHSDLENFRSAWAMACEDNDPSMIADLGMAVTFFAPVLPRSANIAGWVEPVEQALATLGDARRLGKLFNTRARLAYQAGRYVEAVDQQRVSQHFLATSGTERELADAHCTLAFFALRAEDYGTAESHGRQGIDLARKVEDTESEAVALFVLASVLIPRDPDEAERLANQSLALFARRDQRRGMAHAHMALGAVWEHRGDLARAESHYREALDLAGRQQVQALSARYLEAVGRFYARFGKRQMAETVLSAAAEAQHALGIPETARMALPPGTRALVEDREGIDAALERILTAPRAFG